MPPFETKDKTQWKNWDISMMEMVLDIDVYHTKQSTTDTYHDG